MNRATIVLGLALLLLLQRRWPLPPEPKALMDFRSGGRRFGAARIASHGQGPRKHGAIDIGWRGMKGTIPVYSPTFGVVIRHGGWRPGSKRLETMTPYGHMTFGALKPGTLAPVGTLVTPWTKIAELGAYESGHRMLHVERASWRAAVSGREKWWAGKPKPARTKDPTRFYASLHALERARRMLGLGREG